VTVSSVRDLAVAIKAARLAAGLTQLALAERVGVGRVAINRIESGAVTPSFNLILRLADALDLELSLEPRADREPSPTAIDLDDVLRGLDQ
jgi:putative transcriptional regulator